MTEDNRKALHAQLTIAVTAYDQAIFIRHCHNAQVYHNPFALKLYLEAVDRTIASLAYEGVTLGQALAENFTEHMLKYLLRKVKATV